MGPVVSADQLARVDGIVDRAPSRRRRGHDRWHRRDGAGLLLRALGRRAARPRTARSCSARCSVRSSPCSASPTRSRRWPGRTTSTTASPRASGPATSAAPCAWRARCSSARCGSTTTSRSCRELPARRLQAVGLRQGHVDLRDRALHRAQARHGQALMDDRSTNAIDRLEHARPRDRRRSRPRRLLDRDAEVEGAVRARAPSACRSASASSFQAGDPYPIYLARGPRLDVWDVDGNEYVDSHGGFGCMVVGHAHPKIVEAIDAGRAHRHALRRADRGHGRCSPRSCAGASSSSRSASRTRAPKRR